MTSSWYKSSGTNVFHRVPPLMFTKLNDGRHLHTIIIWFPLDWVWLPHDMTYGMKISLTTIFVDIFLHTKPCYPGIKHHIISYLTQDLKIQANTDDIYYPLECIIGVVKITVVIIRHNRKMVHVGGKKILQVDSLIMKVATYIFNETGCLGNNW